MKKLFLFLFLTICCLSCTVEDETVDITVMPEATTTGAETFGCLVDGWLYVGGRYSTVDWREDYDDTPSINFTYSEKRNEMNVSARVKADIWIRYTIQAPKAGQEVSYINALFNEEELEDGKVFITRFDTKKKIISGTFGGGSMSNGRFDVHYKINKYEEAPKQE